MGRCCLGKMGGMITGGSAPACSCLQATNSCGPGFPRAAEKTTPGEASSGRWREGAAPSLYPYFLSGRCSTALCGLVQPSTEHIWVKPHGSLTQGRPEFQFQHRPPPRPFCEPNPSPDARDALLSLWSRFRDSNVTGRTFGVMYEPMRWGASEAQASAR